MTENPEKTEINGVARRNMRATLPSLLIGGVFFAILFIALNAVVRSESTPESIKVMVLITLALGLFFFALALVGDFFIRTRAWRWDSPLLIAIWCYLIPVVYFLCMCLAFTVSVTDIGGELSRFGLILTQRIPVLLLWQGLMLTWYLLRVKKVDPRNIFSLTRSEAASGSLAGIGLGLGVIFIISIESALFPFLQAINTGFIGSEPWAEVFLLIFAVTILPWAEEQYFRGILLDWLGERVGEAGGMILSALLFALLSFRLNLILPGILLGIGLAIIRKRSRLEAAVCAHAVCNLVILGLFRMIAI
jgi:membrane protease YdiL (CAAX protease family)